MKHNYWHKDFQCNGKVFTSSEEIISFFHEKYPDLHQFILEWFGTKGEISMQTSGSTGKPKSISLKREHMVNSAKATADYFGLKNCSKALLCLPLGYIAGRMMLVRSMVMGWHLDVIDPKAQILIPKEKFYDFSAMVPFQVYKNIEQLDRIHTLIVGGGQMSEELKEKIADIETRIFATFGMTETITHIALSPMNLAASEDFSQHMYRGLPHVTFSIDERECLVINAPRISDTAIVTNDLVDLKSDTSFHWLGRYDTIINSGGIKLIPELVEAKLRELIESPFFVYGISDKVFGEKLILIVEGAINSDLLDVIVNHQMKSDNSMLKYEIPKEVFFVDKFHRTQTGKVIRSETVASFLP